MVYVLGFNLFRNEELSDCRQATKEGDYSPGEGCEMCTCFPNALQSLSHIVPDTHFLYQPFYEIRLLKVLDNSANIFYSLQCLISPGTIGEASQNEIHTDLK